MLKNKNFQKAFAVLSAAAFLGSIGGNVDAMKGKGKKPGAHSKLSLEDKQKKKEEVDKKRREAAERKEEEERIRQVKLLEEQKAEYEAKKPEREAEKAKIEAEKAKKKAKAEAERKAKAEAEKKAKAEAEEKKARVIVIRDTIIKRNENVFAIKLDKEKGFNITFKCEVLTSEIMNNALGVCSIWNGEKEEFVINEININGAKEIKQIHIEENEYWIYVNTINITSKENIVFDNSDFVKEEQSGGRIFNCLLPRTINIKCSGDVSIGKYNFVYLCSDEEFEDFINFQNFNNGKKCSISSFLKECQKKSKRELVPFTELNICVDGNLNIEEGAFYGSIFLSDCKVTCKKTLTIGAYAFYGCFVFACGTENFFEGYEETRISEKIFEDMMQEAEL